VLTCSMCWVEAVIAQLPDIHHGTICIGCFHGGSASRHRIVSSRIEGVAAANALEGHPASACHIRPPPISVTTWPGHTSKLLDGLGFILERAPFLLARYIIAWADEPEDIGYSPCLLKFLLALSSHPIKLFAKYLLEILLRSLPSFLFGIE
jgi:hypothetical protein